jgi:hypothetical protein
MHDLGKSSSGSVSVVVGGMPASGGVGSGVGSLPQLGRGTPVPLFVQCVCGFFAVPFGKEGIWLCGFDNA